MIKKQENVIKVTSENSEIKRKRYNSETETKRDRENRQGSTKY